MEDRDSERDNEIVKTPRDLDEAHLMLNKIKSLQDNLVILASDGSISGDIDTGFTYAPRGGSDQPEGPEGPEGPEVPQQ